MKSVVWIGTREEYKKMIDEDRKSRALPEMPKFSSDLVGTTTSGSRYEGVMSNKKRKNDKIGKEPCKLSFADRVNTFADLAKQVDSAQTTDRLEELKTLAKNYLNGDMLEDLIYAIDNKRRSLLKYQRLSKKSKKRK